MTLKVNNIPDWTQAQLNAQIALGNFPVGTVLNDIVLPSDWNSIPTNFVPYTGASADVDLNTRNLKMPSGVIQDAAGVTSVAPNSRQLRDEFGATIATWGGGIGGYFVAPSIATDTIIDTFGGASISVVSRALYSGISSSLSWADRIAYDSSGSPSLDWEHRRLRDSSFNITVDYQNKELIDSQVSLSWSGRTAYDSSGISSLSWQGRELINSLGRTVYNYEQNLMYAFSVSNHAVIDVGGQILYDIADQSSIRWSTRNMYASDGSTVVANYTNSTGMRLYGSVGTGFSTASFTPSARIHAHSLTGIATYQKTTNSVTGALSTDGFDVGISAAGVAEIRQRENLAMEFYTNNTKHIDISAGGLIGIGATASTAKLHVTSTTEQIRTAYNASNYLSTTVSSIGLVTLAAVGTTPSFTLSNNVSITGTNTTVKHLVGGTSTPAIAAGTGAGTTPTVAVAGTDLGGYISVTTGTLPTLSAVVATITFNIAYASAPKAICLTPANSSAASLNGVNMVFIDQAGITTTTFAITAGTTALTAATAYKWYYQVIQ